ncbi:unnamed protein product [Aphis gossypii]|uniref:Uncharacterized protein n=2 Tax=Aphis gossypii TaxID=80765 RepID=A0A9P0NEI0_APHGO|nr:unnamed protein product [Aphis gossypii]
MSEKIHRTEYSSSLTSTSSKIIKSNMKGTTSTFMDSGINKNQCIGIEQKINLTYCLYKEFVITHCDEIISMNKNFYPNSDYSVNLKKQLRRVQFKHQNQQNTKNTKLMDCTDPVNNDFNNMSSISSGSDFIFKPVVDLFKSPDSCITKSSQDSFVCSTQEILFTNSDDSINIDEVKLELNEEYFSSPEICINENTKNSCQIKITDYQSRSTFHTVLEKGNQKSKNIIRSSSISSEDSFKYYRKKMF